MVSYAGSVITTDAIGNTIYDGTFTYTWQHGRQLASATKTGTTVSYKYNADGIRTSKTVNGILHTYDLSGTSIVRECIYNSTGTYVATELRYYYDAKGAPTAMRVFKRTSATATAQEFVCYFATNLQGDVVALYDEDGNRIASYTYDAWGNNIYKTSAATPDISATNAQWLMNINPFRYRGYYYDTDTGLYYLQSRYYNPLWGRFINADTCLYDSLLGHNMFAYCENDPVNYTDPTGKYGEAALAAWAAYAWIPAIAEPTIIGEILYFVGLVIMGTIVVVSVIDFVYFAQNIDDSTPEPDSDNESTGNSTPKPDISYPGDDPTVAPDGYDWTGPDEQGGKRGGYKNPNGKDSWHPDLDHPDGVGPHWDYNDGNGHKWRVFPDGSVEQVK